MAADDPSAFHRMSSRSVLRTTFVLVAAASLFVIAERQPSNAREEQAKPMQIGDIDYATKSPPTKSGYVPVNGLQMYYESHGGGGTPLVLVHGAFSAIGTSFGRLLPDLAGHRHVIAFELQGHGHTADIDRPLSMESMADDVAAAMPQLGVEKADVFGYSMGGGVALRLAIQHPERVRKLVLLSIGYNRAGAYPGFWEGMANFKPEMMKGTPWYEEYQRIASKPGDFATLFAKKTEMDRQAKDLPAEAIKGLPPTLIMMGDSDIMQPEHAVEMFRLLGGGVIGDLAGFPNSQLGILPGTSHSMIINRPDLLLPMITPFLDAPMPAAK
jgi:pimeloyl-ACP methyl ester carboxylesterase